MPEVGVILTCVSSQLAREIIEGVRAVQCARVRVIGVDMAATEVAKAFVDAFHTVPSGKDPAYAQALLDIAIKEGARVVIPGADEEALALAAASERFSHAGIVCTVPRKELIPAFGNKAAMFQRLAQHGVRVPAYAVARSARELQSAASDLGYPRQPLVVKPASGRGGRGVWLLKETASARDLTGSMELESVSLNTLCDALQHAERPEELILMPALAGPVYDVDVLARRTAPHLLVARRRYHPRTTPFRGCVLDANPAVLELARSVAGALNLDYLRDIDIMLDGSGTPHILEVNPRASGSVVSTLRAGLNLYEGLLALALDLPLPNMEIPYGTAIQPTILTHAFPVKSPCPAC